MFLIALLSYARPPSADSLGGITVGSVLDRATFECETVTECVRPQAIAGQPGQLRVSLCGERVQQVSFLMTFAPSSIFVVLGEEQRRRHGVSPLDAVVLARAETVLHEGLVAAGWRRIDRRGDPSAYVDVYENAVGNMRTMTRSPPGQSVPVAYIGLTTASGPDCHSGL